MRANLKKLKVTRHGGYKTPEYRAWADMINRCSNPNIRNYKNYGGRGITVYPPWREDFGEFIAYVGKRPGKGYSIERIDVNGSYEPGNVKWATAKEQYRNTRSTIRIMFNGKPTPMIEVSEEIGVRYKVMFERYSRGWSDADIVLPINSKRTHRREPRLPGVTVTSRTQDLKGKGRTDSLPEEHRSTPAPRSETSRSEG